VVDEEMAFTVSAVRVPFMEATEGTRISAIQQIVIQGRFRVHHRRSGCCRAAEGGKGIDASGGGVQEEGGADGLMARWHTGI